MKTIKEMVVRNKMWAVIALLNLLQVPFDAGRHYWADATTDLLIVLLILLIMLQQIVIDSSREVLEGVKELFKEIRELEEAQKNETVTARTNAGPTTRRRT